MFHMVKDIINDQGQKNDLCLAFAGKAQSKWTGLRLQRWNQFDAPTQRREQILC